ncbi:MAG: tetratricopeptide repeat protein [Polyangiaceae bacterium]
MRAAEIAAGPLGDENLAVRLLGGLLDEEPGDLSTIAKLATLYAKAGRTADLLALRRHELGLTPPLERRLDLRLEAAQLLTTLGQNDAAIAELTTNLDESAGEVRSVEAVTVSLGAAGQFDTLATLLEQQATKVDEAGSTERAAALWLQAATVAEEKLNDVSRSIAAHRRAVKLEPSSVSLDALARMHAARGEFVEASVWLEQRLDDAAGDDRRAVVLRLADAYVGANRAESARALLESELDKTPVAEELRARLATLYRSAGLLDALATLLVQGADHVSDAAAAARYLREAAGVAHHLLRDPARAVDMLRRASELSPDDRAIRVGLADALREAGQLGDARAMLEKLIEEFGRRRTPERAALHYQIALVARAEGKLSEALEHLELATAIDMAHVGALRLLGELSREAGSLDRAERAFRSLLLVVRRLKPGDNERADAVPCPSEVLLELHGIASQMGQEQRASEILESAFEAAADPNDAVRFEAALRKRGDAALLLRALRGRLALETTREGRSAVLEEIGVLLESLGDVAGSFDARLQALEIQPGAAAILESVRALARKVDQSRKLAELLTKLAEAPGLEAALACDLLLAAVDVLESDLHDVPGATAVLARAQVTEARPLDVARAQTRILRASGDRVALADALRRLVEHAELSDTERADALYELASIELSSAESAEAGVERLRVAIEVEPRLPNAAALLREAAEKGFATLALVTLYERVAREVGEPAGLLDALRRLLSFAEATADMAREAARLASEQGQPLEPILERAVALAHEDGHEPAEATWALVQLSEIRAAAGDATGAMRWLKDAFEKAEESESFALGLQLAALAAGAGGDLELALTTYQKLSDRDPGDRAVWVPMIAVARQLNNAERLEALLASVVDRAEDLAERSALRLERARLLLRSVDRVDDAIALLNELLDDDPAHEDAANLLASELEKAGRSEDLILLLERRLDGARDRQDAAAIVSISTRLGALLVPQRQEDARQVYRSALEWAPGDLSLLRSLLALYGPDDDVSERADVLEKVAALETGATAVALSIELADIRRSLDDEAGTTRALELGYKANPADTALREKLEAWFTERKDWSRLAGVIETDAAARADAGSRASRFREAAKLVREQLSDPSRAAELLAKAQDALPDDLALLDELARTLLEAGRRDDAIARVSASLEQNTKRDKARVDRLLLRAELRGEEHEAESIADVEEAVDITGPSLAQRLLDALGSRLQRARERGARDVERDTTHRLVKLYLDAKQADDARALLGDWLAREPSDLTAAKQLLELDSLAERWDAVAAGWARLIELTVGEERVNAVLQLADACDRIGRSEDARAPLERVLRAEPSSAALRARIQKLYETIGAYRELADLHLISAQQATTNPEQIAHLAEAGKLLLYSLNDPAAAAVPIFEALSKHPADHELTVLLVDAYLASGQLPAATQILSTAIEGHRGRRSRELSQLQHRMARAAYANGDRSIELEWLAVAFESDGQNAQVASELAALAMEFQQWDVALKPLRSLTLMKNPQPVTKAMAYLWQGIIAYRQGDPKRAGFLAKKGLQEDPNLQDARDFLAQIGQ